MNTLGICGVLGAVALLSAGAVPQSTGGSGSAASQAPASGIIK